MNKYKKMIESAKASGVADESKMWLSIESIGEWLEELQDEHPKLYKKMIQNNTLFSLESTSTKVLR